MNQIENLKGPKCDICEYAQDPIWGIKGEGNTDILFVLQSSDYRALEHPSGYQGAFLESLTGRDIQRIINKDWRNITLINSIKCHFKENGKWRDPKVNEYRNCFPYLQRQIIELNPKLVVCCGSWAIKGVLGEDEYDNHRPDPYSIQYLQDDEITYTVTMHPRRFTIPIKEELEDTIALFRRNYENEAIKDEIEISHLNLNV
jgi:uracil-DNA glycosylase family 4